MIELGEDTLVFRFPEVHPDATIEIRFKRTLRIPDDDKVRPLPPGLGDLPLERVEEHAARLPAGWIDRGGVLLPMYQAEAMWILLSCDLPTHGGVPYPFAVKIAAGKINAVTGDPWADGLHQDPQDYLIAPDQPWLDGFCVEEGLIRQFVAMPLGRGYTAEEQISGSAEHGGLQILVHPMKRDRYEALPKPDTGPFEDLEVYCSVDIAACLDAESGAMGLAPGGLMRQTVFADHYGPDAWELSVSARCFVHILNTTQWTRATGKPAPGQPPSAADYAAAGLPWFEYYDDGQQAVGGSPVLAGLDSVAAKGEKLGETPLPDNTPVEPTHVVPLGPGAKPISDGNW